MLTAAQHKPCPACNGRGRVQLRKRGPWVTCGECKGARTLTPLCVACSGLGYLGTRPDLRRRCEPCLGTGRQSARGTYRPPEHPAGSPLGKPDKATPTHETAGCGGQGGARARRLQDTDSGKTSPPLTIADVQDLADKAGCDPAEFGVWWTLRGQSPRAFIRAAGSTPHDTHPTDPPQNNP